MNVLIIIIAKFFSENIKAYYEVVVNYSLVMIIFNILPIIPLDGSKVFKTFLEMVFDTEYASDISYYISLIFLSLLLIFFLIFHKWFYLIIIIYLLIINVKEHKSLYNTLYNKLYFLKQIKQSDIGKYWLI